MGPESDLTVSEAYQRIRWYTWLSRLIFWAVFLLLLLSGLKTFYHLSAGYVTWGKPFFQLGAAVKYAADVVYALPGMPLLWNSTVSFDEPWWFLRTGVWASVALVVLAGVMQRAATELRAVLKKAIDAAQIARWQAELLGQPPPQPVTVNQIGVQINNFASAPVPKPPWWTRPKGILWIAVVGGLVVAVVGQWLNIQLGLVK